MVIFSLQIVTELNVVFVNSCNYTTAMREAMMFQQYTELKFYAGGILTLAVCTNVIGLVRTFLADPCGA